MALILGYLELFGGGQQLVPEILHGKANQRQTGALKFKKKNLQSYCNYYLNLCDETLI